MSLNTPSHSRAKFTECDTVSALFAAQAERRSEAIAVSCRGETLTYGELAVRANQLAWYLRRHGVGPEVRVGVCVERSPAMVVALLGIVQAGGAYVPLDPGYPAARLRFMLTDAGVSVLVTETALTGTLGSYDGVVVCLDRDAEIISRERAGPVPESAGPDNLAYVIYTSGSTGMPKGVAVMHRSTVALLDWAREVFSPEELRGILASTSICFDISVFELFVPLCCGGRVILAENLLQLGTLPEANEIMLVNTVPSVLNGYLQVGRLPVSVRTVSLAGEPLPRALVQRLYEIPSIKSVFNLYGPSEDTVFSTFALSSREDEHAPPIGRPV
ncbi:MAG: AMP-binding protein, partial [Chromatiaceae bacterium]|nr:AMP-binding protein [Chromatiaceae bacterium]